MGIRDRFGILFGADLVNAMKPARAYYERAFALAEVDPARVLVLDTARKVGARTVLVGASTPPEFLATAREARRSLKALASPSTVLVGASEAAPGHLAIPSLAALFLLLSRCCESLVI